MILEISITVLTTAAIFGLMVGLHLALGAVQPKLVDGRKKMTFQATAGFYHGCLLLFGAASTFLVAHLLSLSMT